MQLGYYLSGQGIITGAWRATLAPLRKRFAFVAGNDGSSNAGCACSVSGNGVPGKRASQAEFHTSRLDRPGAGLFRDNIQDSNSRTSGITLLP